MCLCFSVLFLNSTCKFILLIVGFTKHEHLQNRTWGRFIFYFFYFVEDMGEIYNIEGAIPFPYTGVCVFICYAARVETQLGGLNSCFDFTCVPDVY